MQDAARSFWLTFDDNMPLDMETQDFGFHDFETSVSNVSILVLSGYKILPNAGGWNDQYESDSEDLLTHLRGLAWARSLKEDEDADETGTEDEEITGDGITDISDWEATFK